jgi:hypothetical protein
MWRITETYIGWAKIEHMRMVKTFKTYWGARLYKFFNYDLGDSIWKSSFNWVIELKL